MQQRTANYRAGKGFVLESEAAGSSSKKVRQVTYKECFLRSDVIPNLITRCGAAWHARLGFPIHSRISLARVIASELLPRHHHQDLPDGMGTFLEPYSMSDASAAAVDGFRRRRRGGKRGKGGNGGRRSRSSVSPAIHEGSELVGTAANVRQRARSSVAVANAPSTSVRSPSPQSRVSDSSVQHMSVSGAHGKGSKFSGPGKGSLSITMRLQGFENTSLNQPMLHKKPKYRRSTKLKSFEEMAGRDKHQVTQLLIPSRPGFVDLRANCSRRY